ncbi:MULTISPECIES: anaerobic ribonucleoside-triphosphate reductase activating protein [unclassified Ruminococcus]|uniref:anaerobic ribonucleoside-triphosphate reductase activating protein n=1 Tax=unclassified Ruminococcus TaxID=2608920 RepID=UPI00210A1A8C|nr:MULTISPECIES: anaerobic ribonucleoside-triphosphate reductase activating protein [unclassified Ruminococcus]MCQ4022303.1 anaerobic ribonucleoside-triphosphate reductase activating protein [Ruminococcus sp. zg-924]MCQ4114631.1 anaerobic ribonucleoside-triphosphate reductase activating protein [Ruminococcus sp. zg-921]
MNYATIKPVDVANGTGVRVSLFVSGCTHKCKGCFNSEAWDFNYGELYTDETQRHILFCLDKTYIRGLSLLGGEPFDPHNQETLIKLVREVRKTLPQKDIWCYTGYDFEKDLNGKFAEKYKSTAELLSLIDILVDGKFVQELKNPSLKFRGSSNQRIIDVQSSLKTGETVLCDLAKI